MKCHAGFHRRLIPLGFAALVFVSALGQPALARPHYPWQDSYKAVVDQTAAVVQGVVTDIRETYSEEEGPRTVVTLARLNVLWGDLREESVTLKLFGGPVPGRVGRIDEVHVPTFVRGKSYLVFLSNRDWRLSPVTARQTYLVESIYGRDIVVTTDGFAVAGIDDVTGPIPTFTVFDIPDELPDDFVPRISEEVTPDLVSRASSPEELVESLQRWAKANQVTVNGSFTDQPYRSTANWRFPRMTPDPTDPPRDPVFEPRTDRPFRPEREQDACGDPTGLPCPDDNEGGVQ